MIPIDRESHYRMAGNDVAMENHFGVTSDHESRANAREIIILSTCRWVERKPTKAEPAAGDIH